MPTFFYQDDSKKEIKEEFLTNKAKSWAENFISPKQPKERWERNPKLTSAQLRRFHIEAKTLEERVRNMENPEKEFPGLRPLVKMLKSKVAYACPNTGRDRKVPDEFRKYIEEMVDHIEDHRDFMAFALCFEAVVGFFYGQGGR
ncbi:MAG: type III-A CRISPR-associated protein Csm2 [Nitrospinae bacterium]|nr:type III-A CRISPR-associated protein Csm2 [Nitrospinota bacterium]